MSKPRIAMISMFRNESASIRRMLDSCVPHIDYWVLQDNGSTDGTADIVKQWHTDTGIPGHLYSVAEGWKGFGWNRDHLITTCQSLDHGCDWILKMDCDETLAVRDDFDWQILSDISVQAWNVPVVANSYVYFRSWLYNARLPWRFNHDPCHETVYCDLEGIKENYSTRDLPMSFHHVWHPDGQSWGVPTKFVSDSLILEEKLIREGTMLANDYHFFYVGKSYHDSLDCSAFPLGDDHRREYCRRTIFYLTQYINRCDANQINEMCYQAHIYIGGAFERLDETQSAEIMYRRAEPYAPERNDHLWALAQIYRRQKKYDDLLAVSSRMMESERVCPFPTRRFFIDRNIYHDTGEQVKNLHDFAINAGRIHASLSDQNTAAHSTVVDLVSEVLLVAQPVKPRLWVVDNFYHDPDAVRELAMQQEFHADIRWYKGVRTQKTFRPANIRQAFESIMGRTIRDFDSGYNGCFQITTSQDPQVYHHDTQTWAAMIYLTPDAPVESGTRLHRSKVNQVRDWSQGQEAIDQAFATGFYDSTRFDTIDSVGNIYNRLVIMDAQHIHSAGPYFGNSLDNGRLVQLFFFD